MKVYGRIQNGVVAELISTDRDISTMFNPALVWVDLTSQPTAAAGWEWDGTRATAPAVVAVSAGVTPATLAQLQTQIGVLQERLQALSPATVPAVAAR